MNLRKNILSSNRFFQQLLDDHVIELLDKQNTIGIREDSDKIDYVVPRGISSVVRYFFEQAGKISLSTSHYNTFEFVIVAVEMNLLKRIVSIDLNSTKDKYTISTDEGQVDEAEAVIVTVPVPQVLSDFKGSIAQLIGTFCNL